MSADSNGASTPPEQPKRVVGRPFPKGVSGNPGGRPAAAAPIREKARKLKNEAFDRIVEVMRSSEKGSEILAAARTVLQIGGIPMNAVATPEEVAKDEPAEATPEEVRKALEGMN